MPMITPNDIAQAVHYFRKQSGLSQQQLALLAGIGKTVVFDIEKGKPTVQLNSLLRVLEVLNIDLQLDTPFAQPNEEKQK